MINQPFDKSCVVALYRERNCATNLPLEATTSAPINATQDLQALAARVLERTRRNAQSNSDATIALRSCFITATTLESELHHLKNLIWQVSQLHGGDTEEYLDLYLKEVIAENSIEQALLCFATLITQRPFFNKSINLYEEH